MRIVIFLTMFVMSACTGVPKGISPVADFSLQPYLGKWYEIARLDHSFERGLSNVTAQYKLLPDNGVEVKNRGYRESEAVWKEAVGKAYFVGATDTAHLKVSFFGPFYGSYVVFKLADDYQYAYVTGNNRKSLWFLSRSAIVSDAMYEQFLQEVDALGFDISEIIRVQHDRQ